MVSLLIAFLTDMTRCSILALLQSLRLPLLIHGELMGPRKLCNANDVVQLLSVGAAGLLSFSSGSRKVSELNDKYVLT